MLVRLPQINPLPIEIVDGRVAHQAEDVAAHCAAGIEADIFEGVDGGFCEVDGFAASAEFHVGLEVYWDVKWMKKLRRGCLREDLDLACARWAGDCQLVRGWKEVEQGRGDALRQVLMSCTS